MTTVKTTYNTLDIPGPKMAGHNNFHVFTIIVAFIGFLFMITLNILANYEVPGLFGGEGVGNISDKYYTDITPAGFTFSIWGLIYTWQVIWLLYALASICRQGNNGPLYRSPVLLPSGFFIVYIINNIVVWTWLLVWDREILIAAFVVLALSAITLYICIGISMKYLVDKTPELTKAGMLRERWWIWLAVQNGLAIFATWTSLASMINMAVVMEYVAGVEHKLCGTVALSIIVAGLLFWSIFELAALDQYARYLFMPYLVVCWALGGVIAAHWGVDWQPTDRNAIYTAVVLAIAITLGVTKIFLMIYRHITKPLVAMEITSTLKE